MHITIEDTKQICLIIGTIVTSGTLIKALFEYRMNNVQRRAEHFFRLREEFNRAGRFTDLFELLEQDSAPLSTLSVSRKYDLLGFYEDIALNINSGLLNPQVAHYMFSYFALKCWDSHNFWSNLNRDSLYWSLFANFVKRMKECEDKLSRGLPHTQRMRL